MSSGRLEPRTELGMGAAPAIRASVLLVLVAEIDRVCGRADELLARHAIGRSQLDDPYSLIPIARYVAFFEDAAALTGDDCFGARLGTSIASGDIGPAGLLFSQSATIRSAASRISWHINAVQGDTSIALHDVGDHLVWVYQLAQHRYWPRRQDSEFTLSAFCRFIQLGFSRDWTPLEIHFEHVAPRHAADLARIFKAPVRFGQSSNRILFDRSEADRVFRVEDAALCAVLERHIHDLAAHKVDDRFVSDKVRALVDVHLGHQPVSLMRIAADLGSSERSLQRRLAAEGTSLRRIVQECRYEAMVNQFDARLKKQAVAANLGYADSTAFWRARKAWHAKRLGEQSGA